MSTTYETPQHPGHLVAFVDGACSGNPGPAGSGMVVFTPGKRHEASHYLGDGTNNIAELTAIQLAAEYPIESRDELVVYTDSKYSVGVLSLGWKAKANRELIGRVKQSLERWSKWKLVHVRGHAGIEWNERADVLATDAVARRSTETWSPID